MTRRRYGKVADDAAQPATPRADGVEAVRATPALDTKRVGRNVVVIVLSEIIGKCATLAFTIIVARELGATAFGSFSYALAYGLLLGMAVSWGFDSVALRRGSANRGELNAALTEAVVLRTVHAIPVVLIGGTVGTLIRPDRPAALALVLVLMATTLDGYGDAGRSAATAAEQPGRAAAALVVQRVAACAFVVVALAAGGDLVWVSAAYLLSSIVGLLTLALVLRRIGIRLQVRQLRLHHLTRMWRWSFLLGLDSLVAMALFRVDALMLGNIAGDRELASYSVAYRLMETVLFVNWAVIRSLLPAMVRAGSGRALLRVGENALSITAAVLVPYGVLLWMVGGDLIELLFGTEYGSDATVSLTLLAAAPLAFGLSQVTGYLLFVRKWNARSLAVTSFSLVLNLVLNLVLIPEHGARGAALATTVSYAVDGLASTFLLYAGGNGAFRIDRALLLPIGAAIPMGAALMAMHLPVLLEAALAGLLYLIAYAALARWRDPRQLDLVLSIVKRG